MDSKTDAELIELHRQGSHEAFAELVRRHINWIYSTARRRVRDEHLAEDITQAAFSVLAKKAPRLNPKQPLSAWLFHVVALASKAALRTESRRRHHETEAAKMRNHEQLSQADSWESLAPDLDELVGRLGKKDRASILLRFYQQQSYSNIATAMGISEVAARRRVSRAIERLRGMLLEHRKNIPAAVLAGVMLSHVSSPAPSSLAATISLTGSSATGSALTLDIFNAMNALKVKLIASMCLGSAIAVGTVVLIAGQLSPLRAQTSLRPATSPATRPTAPLVITGEQWLSDRTLIAGLAPVVASLERVIRFPAGPFDLVEIRSAAVARDALPAVDKNVVLHIENPYEPDPSPVSLYLFNAVDRWPGPPNFAIAGRTNQTTTATVPAGKYHVIASIGTGATLDMIGVTQDWPNIVEIGEPILSSPTPINVRLSLPLTRSVRQEWVQSSQGLSHIRGRASIEANSLSAVGRVLYASGEPIQGATVQLRQHREPDARSNGIAAPDATTNADGYFAFEPYTFRYSFGAMLAWPLDDVPGFRWRYIRHNKILEGKQRLDITIPDWPNETGTVVGRVLNHDGTPVDAFLVAIDRGYWPNVGTTPDPLIDNWGIKAGFTNGHFELRQVPTGECTVTINMTSIAPTARQRVPSDSYRIQVARLMGMQGTKLTIEPGKTVQIDVKLPPSE